MKILTVVSNAVPGFMGGELKVALSLAKGYAEHGLISEILTFGNRTNEMPNTWTIKGIPVKKITTPRDHSENLGLSTRTILENINNKLKQNIQDEINGFDIIHLHNLHSLSLVKFFVDSIERQESRLFWTVHDNWFEIGSPSWVEKNYSEYDLGKFDRKLKLELIRRRTKVIKRLVECDCIVAPSKAIGELLTNFGFPHSKIRLIYNGVNFPEKALYDPNSNNVVYIGYLGKGKGILCLLDAMKIVSLKNKDIALKIAGSGELMDEIESFVKINRMRERIDILGFVAPENIDDLYCDARAVILPSIDFENCSMVILESIARGIPVITTSTGGNPELIIDGKSGFVVPPKDEQALSKAILKSEMFKETNGISEELRLQERSRFSTERMVKDYIQLIKEV